MEEPPHAVAHVFPDHAISPGFAVFLDRSADVADAVAGLGCSDAGFQAEPGGFDQLKELIAEDATWHLSGRSLFSDDYRGHDSILGLFKQLADFTNGTLEVELHDVLANEQHAVALARYTASRARRSLEMDACDTFHLRDGRIVDFHKQPTAAHDDFAEWIGFLRLSAEIAGQVEATLAPYIEAGRTDFIYEQVFRDILHRAPDGAFGTVDVSDLPWTEIDFPSDLEYAKSTIFPALLPLPE